MSFYTFFSLIAFAGASGQADIFVQNQIHTSQHYEIQTDTELLFLVFSNFDV